MEFECCPFHSVKGQGCDGTRPVCNPCRLRPPRSLVPCQYSHTPTASKQHSPTTPLDDMPNNMGNGIRASSAVGQEALVYLSDPYVSPKGCTYSQNGPWSSTMYQPHFMEASTEPPAQVIERLFDVFWNRFSSSGLFFLEPVQFRASFLLQLPVGHPFRPAPGLLSAMYLWCRHMSSNNATHLPTENELLTLTTQNLAHDLGHPRLVLQTIQAQTLLSYYYLNSARLLEGDAYLNQHCTAAVSLAWCVGIKGTRWLGTEPDPPFAFSRTFCDPMNEIKETERINTFWGLLLLNNFWLAASGISATIPYDVKEISLPWPTNDTSFSRLADCQTVARFLGGEDLSAHSPVALLVKSSILVERVIAFCTQSTGDSGANQFSGPEFQTLLVTRCFANVAMVRLHAPRAASSAESIGKSLMAARQVVSDVNKALLLEWQYADPMLGPLILSVCNFSILQPLSFREKEIELQPLLSFMSRLAQLSPMIQHYYAVTYTSIGSLSEL
ncbi:hypothetical protein MVEN_01308400 [Mycena venus]|uniref:Transcription factor domain-containing protein n=1 Tax=Mycena venus TaxID=2733690 RepID=A0A8H7CW06_9AGAR|nr:hypothetical protein MVEN_01308400 [Mycena venus]